MPILLVTGGLGFVMSHVARQWLYAARHNRVLILDPCDVDDQAKQWFKGGEDRLTHVQASATDRAALDALPDGITHVVHGAAVTSINRLAEEGRGLRGILPAVSANIDGTAEVLAWAVARGGIARYVNVSSGSVYANEGPAVMTEDGPVDPDGYYGVSKYTGEMLTAQTARQFGLSAVSVRLSGVYGPMDRETPHRAVQCVPMRILRAALEGRPLKVHAPDAIGDFIHAGCVARAIMALLSHDAPCHPVYNIAYGEAVSNRHMIGLAQTMVPGFQWEETAEACADLVGDMTRQTACWGAYDISRIGRDTGWAPMPLGDAFADYLDWFHRA